jgi:hypothetical protein
VNRTVRRDGIAEKIVSYQRHLLNAIWHPLGDVEWKDYLCSPTVRHKKSNKGFP